MTLGSMALGEGPLGGGAAPIEEERPITDGLTDLQRDLERADDVVSSYLQHVCDRRSFTLRGKDWYRLASESRIKDADGVKRALGRARAVPADLLTVNDLVAARIVVLTLTDAEELAQFIEADAHPFDTMVPNRLERDSGYRAIHLKGSLKNDRLAIGCEIQIRTALQDAWAVVSRGGVYGEPEPSFVGERTTALAERLAEADQELDQIRAILRRPVLTSEDTTVKSFGEERHIR